MFDKETPLNRQIMSRALKGCQKSNPIPNKVSSEIGIIKILAFSNQIHQSTPKPLNLVKRK